MEVIVGDKNLSRSCRRVARFGISDQRQFRTSSMDSSRSDGAPFDCADVFDNHLKLGCQTDIFEYVR